MQAPIEIKPTFNGQGLLQIPVINAAFAQGPGGKPFIQPSLIQRDSLIKFYLDYKAQIVELFESDCFYTVSRGRKMGIFKTWADTEKQTGGFPRGSYQKFSNIDSAIAHLYQTLCPGPATSSSISKVSYLPLPIHLGRRPASRSLKYTNLELQSEHSSPQQPQQTPNQHVKRYLSPGSPSENASPLIFSPDKKLKLEVREEVFSATSSLLFEDNKRNDELQDPNWSDSDVTSKPPRRSRNPDKIAPSVLEGALY